MMRSREVHGVVQAQHAMEASATRTLPGQSTREESGEHVRRQQHEHHQHQPDAPLKPAGLRGHGHYYALLSHVTDLTANAMKFVAVA